MSEHAFTVAGSSSDSFSERRVSLRRIGIAGIILLALLLALVARLVYLQVITYSENVLESDDNRIQILPIPSVRGQVMDRNGRILANNIASYELSVIPDQAEDLMSLLDELKEIVEISDQESEMFLESVKKGSSFGRHVLKENLTTEEIARLAVERHRLRGAEVHADLRRHYLHPEDVAHVLGRVGRIASGEIDEIDSLRYRGLHYVGKNGVELAMENVLVGYAGNKWVETNAHGRILRTLSTDPAESGQNVYMTIDSELQRVAYEALGEFRGAAVAIEPSTGRILAMVSKPSYNPNSLLGGATRQHYRRLLNEDGAPLINRAIQGTYSPGSVLKVFLGLAIKEVHPNPPEIFCPGYYTLPGKTRRYRCWKRQGHGKMSLHQAIVESCDVYFYELARMLGIDEMHYRLSRFGFGERTQVQLSNEKEGLLPSQDWKRYVRNESWYPGETLIFGIGQGFTLTTMMQLAQATSVLANRGKGFKPQIVLKTEDVNSGSVRYVEPEPLPSVELEHGQAYQTVIDAMVDVIHSDKGTARKIRKDIQYTAAGKTGTVQVIQVAQNEEWDPDNYQKRFHPHGIFVSFAPVEDPKIVVAVIAENSDGASKVAVPAARAIMDYYLLGDLATDDANEPGSTG